MVLSMTINKDFQKLIAKRVCGLLRIAGYLSRCQKPKEILTRPLLGELFSQSSQFEELLDAYGAQGNSTWRRLRSLTAAIKLFSNVSYELLHIRHRLPLYRLLPIELDFVKATEKTLGFTCDILIKVSIQIIDEAYQLSLPVSLDEPEKDIFYESLPEYQLERDISTRQVENVPETATMLATAFLNLAGESEILHSAGKLSEEDNSYTLPDSVSEESLRLLELRFHNLQSLYDTYVSQTEAEALDTDLPVLRGHISVVFHLLKTATAFAHYYERHVSRNGDSSPFSGEFFVDGQKLLECLINYSLNFSSCYLRGAEQLCYGMLKRYAEIVEIEVPVPEYRGFHIRPSTLVSKIVNHYGSSVEIRFDEETCNAAVPLEIFRINEKINADKRHSLCQEISELDFVHQEYDARDLQAVIRRVVLMLAEQGKIILYEQPLELPDDITLDERLLLKCVTDEIKSLQAMGKVDISTNLKVTFVGDKRVLADLQVLADCGYGEDKFGNNISLPTELSYLKR
jgi:hypothetical protein